MYNAILNSDGELATAVADMDILDKLSYDLVHVYHLCTGTFKDV